MSNRIALVIGAAIVVFFAWLLLTTAGSMHDIFVVGMVVVGTLVLVGLLRPPRRHPPE